MELTTTIFDFHLITVISPKGREREKTLFDYYVPDLVLDTRYTLEIGILKAHILDILFVYYCYMFLLLIIYYKESRAHFT